MKSLILGIWLTYGSDAASTHYALTHYNGREALIPTQSPYAIDAVIIGEATLTSFSVNWLDKHEHPKVARIIGWTAVGLRGFVVVHNIKEMRK